MYLDTRTGNRLNTLAAFPKDVGSLSVSSNRTLVAVAHLVELPNNEFKWRLRILDAVTGVIKLSSTIEPEEVRFRCCSTLTEKRLGVTAPPLMDNRLAP